MKEALRARDRRALGGGLTVMLIILLPLWFELNEPQNLGWNVFLGVVLFATLVVAFLLQRHFLAHPTEVGEARFDTRNKSNPNG